MTVCTHARRPRMHSMPLMVAVQTPVPVSAQCSVQPYLLSTSPQQEPGPPCAMVREMSCMAVMRCAKPPSLEALWLALARAPRDWNSTMMTLVWYRMLASMLARPRMLSSGRKCPVKKGPMMSSTAQVAARYLCSRPGIRGFREGCGVPARGLGSGGLGCGVPAVGGEAAHGAVCRSVVLLAR